jgi:hypothetical protein
MAKSFKELAEEANSLPIKEVLEGKGCVFTGYGPNLKCPSPLRDESSLGSFNINVPMNIFHDWKLDIAGGPVRFYMELYNIPFVDAVKRLASDFNLGNFQGRPDAATEKSILTVKTTKKVLDIELMDTVYNIFLDMCSITEEDKSILKLRGFDDEEISRYKFKTFPRRVINFRKELEAKVKEATGTADSLFSVPGFFKKEGEPFSFGYQSGIIIPCRNYENKIVGLQIRKRDNSPNKYVWFSSAYCLKDDADNSYVADGLSPGSPIGFELGRYKSKIFITEGFFKAVKIRKTYGMSALSIQGVTNWRPIMKSVEGLKKLYPKFKGVIIAYDSDMCYNINVLTQAANLGDELVKNDIDVTYALWSYSENTKGIDDLIEEVGDIRPYLHMVSHSDFKKGVDKCLLKVNGKSSAEEVFNEYTKNIFNIY